MRFRIAREFFSAAVKALSLLVLLLTLLLLPQCAWEMPGCSEGEIDRNPLESNLIEYTVPATGHIKRKSEFNILQVVFLVPMVEDTFSVEDDMGMCRLGEGERVCTPNPATDYFDEDDVDWLAPDILKLNVKPGSINPERYYPERYMIRFFKDGPISPLTSVQNSVLDDDVDIYITVVSDDEERTRPYIAWVDPDYIVSDYIAPHERISFTFSERMGYINWQTEPLWGFYFRAITEERTIDGDTREVTIVQTESIQGLTPGQGYNTQDEKYWVAFWSDDVEVNELAPSMDRYGNPLALKGQHQSRSFQLKNINVSHVRILFPFHTPFAVADDWLDQLPIYFIDNPYTIVQVSNATRTKPDGTTGPLVSELRSDYFGHQEDVLFDTVHVENPGQVIQISNCTIDNFDTNGVSVLKVHSYDSDGNWLGADKLPVYAHPEPDRWLLDNPSAAASVNWQDRDTLLNWSEWPTELKRKLRTAFRKTRVWFNNNMSGDEPVDLDDPPENIWPITPPIETARTALSADDAWKMYLSYLAMSLVVEIDSHVPWSITEFENTESLMDLLDSRTMFSWYSMYGVDYYFLIDSVVPSPPAFTFKNISISYIASTPRESIVMFMEWCRDNLFHFSGNPTYGNMYNHYGRLAYPPVSKIYSGTNCTETYPPPDIGYCVDPDSTMNYTSGCHVTVGFIRAVLRTLNIPVETMRATPGGHRQALFPEVSIFASGKGAYLTHGDLLYARPYRYNETKISPEYLLISRYKYEEIWYDEDVCFFVKDRLINRPTYEVATVFYTNVIMKDYCYDINTYGSDFFEFFEFTKYEDCVTSSLCMNFEHFLDFEDEPLPDPCKSFFEYGIEPLVEDWVLFITELGDKVDGIGGCSAVESLWPITCWQDSECDDGQYCNGVEVCKARSCWAGDPVDCDDGDPSTNDFCDEENDVCQHI